MQANGVQQLINIILSLGTIALIVVGSLCMQGEQSLCGPKGYDGGVIMVAVGATFLGLQCLVFCCLFWGVACYACFSGLFNDSE